MKGGDIIFGNLEGPFIEEGTARKCGEEPGSDRHCYEFRTPPRYAAYLAEDGFNAVSVANNHILDFGAEGLTSTLKTLDAAHIQAVGGQRVARFHIKGKNIALAGFSFSASPSAGSILYIKRAAEIVKGLKAKNDIVIVSFHGGAEGREALHVSDVSEEYEKEMRGNVLRFSRTAVDAGADMVIGHGPHVLRAMEVYKRKLIAYSLGSFLVYGRFNIDGPSGISVVMKAVIDADTGNFVSGRLVPITLKEGGIPHPDEGRASVRLIKSLTEKDFGPFALLIKEDGLFYPPNPPAKKSWLRSLLNYIKRTVSPVSSGP